MSLRAAITAVGHYAPEKVLTNAMLETMVNTTNEWIMTRTGIRERRVLENGASSDMAVKAAEMVLANRGISPLEIDLIIVTTVTPDMFFPTTACLVQEKIGAKNAWAFDMNAACSGFVYALSVGQTFIEAGRYKKILVIGTDKMTSIVDYTDRNTCVLFGDGAGAVLLEPTEDGSGIIDHKLYADGAGAPYLYMKAGGSLHPATHETIDKKMHNIYQDGKNVFKAAVVGMADVSAEILERNNLTGATVDWLVPHQANLRIIDATAKRMELDASKVMINIDRYGNTTTATIPLCISEWWHAGKLKKGQNVILASFGAGYTWGAMYIKWAIDPPAGKK
ncbi:MAG TPA: beta-ketoacyl-ACP synthase III [Bacteroidota bacterium]|nr:beta-ketoacyl-ACP synthase III [Bacteroidota bacterium]